MRDYKVFELHTHTRHSDGTFTGKELCESAVAFEYDGIAMTDHNTTAPWQEITDELVARTLPVIFGIEWTTFFGHMLVLNASEYVDWRFATPDNIDEYIEKIKKLGGVVGLAHPNCVGNPMCTGCHWDFKVKNWHNVDYIEVWSKPTPMEKYDNLQSHTMWTNLLNEGYKLAATAGRDWHGRDKADFLETTVLSATYLGFDKGEEITSTTAANAIAKGRTFVSVGPVINMVATQNDKTYEVGDSLDNGKFSLKVDIDQTTRKKYWEHFGINATKVDVIVNGETVISSDKMENVFELDLNNKWLRVEVFGDYKEDKNVRLAFTSPIYVGY